MDPISTITSTISLINSVKDQYDTVCNNIERCKLLNARIQLLSKPLEVLLNRLLDTGDGVDGSGVDIRNLQLLHATVKRSKEFIEKYGSQSWRRRCLNTAYANSIYQEYQELSTDLSNAANDLSLAVTVDKLEVDRACRADDERTMQIVLEMLQVNGATTQRINESIQDQSLTFMSKMNKFERQYSDLFKKTEVLLEVVAGERPEPQRPDVRQQLLLNHEQLQWDAGLADGVLGSGSFATVHKARYYNCDIALKYFKDLQGSADASELLAFRREALIMQSAMHRNIVSFIGADIERGLILMERATCSLHDLLYRVTGAGPAPLSKGLRAKIVIEVCRGLRYLHYHDIVHRDIKASNILLFVSTASVNITAKVGDFGVSTSVGMTITKRASTRAVGSAPYMAPELLDFDAAPPYGQHTDVYAFGVLMNEVMSRKKPFAGCNEMQILSKVVLKKERPEIFEPKSALDLRVIDLIGSAERGCLSSQPVDRPSSLRLSGYLETLLEGVGLSLKMETTARALDALARLPDRRASSADASPVLSAAASSSAEAVSTKESAASTKLPRPAATISPPLPPKTNIRRATSPLLHHPGMYCDWSSERCFQCCLSSDILSSGCIKGEPRHHPKRYYEGFMGMLGYWTCCNQVLRSSFGCVDGRPPLAFHPGMFFQGKYDCCGDSSRETSGCTASPDKKFHSDLYVSGKYLCCGKTGRDALGCASVVNRENYHAGVHSTASRQPMFECCKVSDPTESGCRRYADVAHHSGRFVGREWNCCKNRQRRSRGCVAGPPKTPYHPAQLADFLDAGKGAGKYECCLRGPESKGCRIDEVEKYHPRRFAPSILSAFTENAGVYLCCKGVSRTAVGCVLGRPGLRYHSAMFEDYSLNPSRHCWTCCEDTDGDSPGCIQTHDPTAMQIHVGYYMNGAYQCCKDKSRQAHGCVESASIPRQHHQSGFSKSKVRDVMRWDCCKATNPNASGCCRGEDSYHLDSYVAGYLFHMKLYGSGRWKCCSAKLRGERGCALGRNPLVSYHHVAVFSEEEGMWPCCRGGEGEGGCRSGVAAHHIGAYVSKSATSAALGDNDGQWTCCHKAMRGSAGCIPGPLKIAAGRRDR